MSEFIPTPSQYEAIHTRASAVLVSAGAGSGKTKVLTERLMSYITDEKHPADIDSFLVITFTRAAAGELKGRIMSELGEAIAKNPSDRHLRRQNALCARANIGTIHSFCASLLRENCHVLGLSPDFAVADEERANAMKVRALERVMDARYEKIEQYPAFAQLVNTVSPERDDRRLCQLVLELHSKMQSHARPEKWAAEQADMLENIGGDIGATPWGREILDRVKASAAFWAGELEGLAASMKDCPKIAKGYLANISNSAEHIRELERAADLGWDRARECVRIPFERAGTVKSPENAELFERIKNRRNACKDAMKALEKYIYSDSATLLSELASTSGAMKALLALEQDFDRAYSADKRRAALVDYADLEHMTAELLTDMDGNPTELAGRISERFTEIMVDEYQDVSRVQDTVFRALSKNGSNLFMVGDVKQSIYRFRLADPGIFTEKYLSYKDYTEALPGEPRRILLQENFRSRREILSAANSVFSLCMSRALGDIDYDEDAKLKYGATAYNGEADVPEILLIASGSSQEDEESPDRQAEEAETVALKIRSLVESGTMITAPQGERKLEYGDIAILLRSVNVSGKAFRNALIRYGIPVASGKSGDFFSSIEVSTVMSMLNIIDNPHKDIPLIAVLRSPCFGFEADELSEMRAADKNTDLYTAMKKYAQTDEKSKNFLDLLDTLRAEAPDMSAAELTWRVINALNMLSVCAAMPGGEQRRSNLMELIELGEKFEATMYRGLHRYVRWLTALVEKGTDMGGGSSGGVSVMSMHKSKGLEFPVVFLCDMDHGFNRQDSRDTVLVHPELGLGPKVTDVKRRIEYPSLARIAIALRLEREMLSEEMRILYVAMTRARERLFITAAMKDPYGRIDKLRETLSVPMDSEILSKARSSISWLIYSALADGEGHIKLSVIPPMGSEKAEQADAQRIKPDEDFKKELERQLSFEYSHADAVDLPSKITATELKGRDETDPDALSIAPKRRVSFPMPDFTKKNSPLTGAERGTATHLVLQYMDFAKTGSEEEIRLEAERLYKDGFISLRELEAVDCGAIAGLFASPIGRRMMNADGLKREFKFSLLLNAAQVTGRAEGEEILLQGVVDCFIEENGELTVIDYKTDAVHTQAQLKARGELYASQIRAYAAALERICGKRVRECVLYFLSMGRELRIEM